MARLALTAEQQAVVTAPDGPLLVLAGPGAGKTAVLTARIAQLITDRGVGPASVLALTFSNRAAQELRARLAERLGDKGNVVDVATFHNFGLRVVRQWRTRLGFPANRLTVYDAQAARAVFTDVVRACGVPAGGLPLRVLWHVVEHYRMTGSGGAHAATLQALTAAYEAELRRRGAVDFPAMLREPLRLLQAHPDVARLYRVAYRAILVDEAQDTCPTQYALVRLLAAQHRHLTMVGDPAQCLYAWRGADGSVLRAFLRDCPDAQVRTLQQNFRSTPEIVAVANAIGTHLPGCLPLHAAAATGPPSVLHLATDDAAEGRFIAAEIVRLLASGVVRSAGEVAILVRTNGQAEPIANALRARSLACAATLANGNAIVPGGALAGEQDPSLTGVPRRPAPGRVRLLTIHAAKGLEWSVVFVAGFEDGLLPHARSLQDGAAGLDQERRVAYVAVTRPQRRLYLTGCCARCRGGALVATPPSRFLHDLDGLPLTRAA